MPVSIRGMAVHCAVGTQRSACAQALRANVVDAANAFVLPDITPPIRVHYRPLAGTSDPFARGRLAAALHGVLSEVLHEAALSASERAVMPVFLGSSCFSVRDAEQNYQQARRNTPDRALPMAHISLGELAHSIAVHVGSRAAEQSFHTACSSASHALLGALHCLRAGLARQALVVGVEMANLTSLTGFTSLQLLGDTIAPFCTNPPGMVLGEGIGALVLEASAGGPLQLAGGAARVDTHAATTGNPDGSAVTAVIEAALDRAGIEPAQIRAVVAHATGTASNDQAEANGLQRVFSTLPPCVVLKPRIGHTLGACGVVELVLLASALEQGFVPGAPRGPQDPSEPVQTITPLREPIGARPGHYLLNQFGFGGNNAALVLEKTC